HFIVPAVVELRRGSAGVIRNPLCMLQQSAVEQVGGDTGRTEAMTANRRGESHRSDAPLHHFEHTVAIHPLLRDVAPAVDGSKEGSRLPSTANGAQVRSHVPLGLGVSGKIETF